MLTSQYNCNVDLNKLASLRCVLLTKWNLSESMHWKCSIESYLSSKESWNGLIRSIYIFSGGSIVVCISFRTFLILFFFLFFSGEKHPPLESHNSIIYFIECYFFLTFHFICYLPQALLQHFFSFILCVWLHALNQWHRLPMSSYYTVNM